MKKDEKEKVEYPKYLYDKDGSAVLVESKEEHDKKGKGLLESPPAKAEAKTEEKKKRFS